MKKSDKLGILIPVLALLMIGYHIWATWMPTFNAVLHQNIHLAFSFLVLLLVAFQKAEGKSRIGFLMLMVASLVVVSYVHINYDRLDMWSGFPETVDVYIGIVMVLMVVYLTLKRWGGIFPVLLGISVLYALFGHLIEGPLGHPEIGFKEVVSGLGIGLNGIYGMMLNASANLIFLFIIFGSLFEAVGIDRFFLEIGVFMGRKLRGGAAQTAIFSSSFVGMCTGAAAANVALTGSYTIPMMKKTGFSPSHAGAVEAVASTGGQLTPPVMGVAIFLMASFLGIGYGELMARALLPAVVFYIVLIAGVIMIASREKIPKLKTTENRSVILRGAPLFIIPMGLVTFLLVSRYTPSYTASIAMVVLLFVSVLQKETRPSFSKIISGLTKGAIMGSAIAVACACIGMFTAMLTSTGAGPKFAGIVQTLSGGNLFLALFLTMILTIMLGCAMPTPVAYVITALIVSPALVEMGIGMMEAHFFVFYFAVLSAVTPPVAGAALVGSQIAGSSYLETGWISLKLVLPFFVVPFFLIHNPIILSKSQSLLEAVGVITALVVCCIAFLIFCHGYCFGKINLLQRSLFVVVAVLSIVFSQTHIFSFMFASLILGVILLLGFWRLNKNTLIQPLKNGV